LVNSLDVSKLDTNARSKDVITVSITRAMRALATHNRDHIVL
jgi:hypothetical protein